MGTKKATAKAKPPVVLRVGMIWTDPKSGKKYDVVEGDGSCKNCALHSVYGGECPIDDPIYPLPCDAEASGTDKGVRLVEVSGATTKKAARVQPTMDNALVLLKELHDSPYQTRKARGDLEGLAASLRQFGMLNPVTVRQMGKNDYELIAGHRRASAARLAGMKSVPATVVECDDQAAAELCVTENMQRLDLTPLEEAEGVAALLNTGHTMGDIAVRLGRTRQWVARRASLRNLTEAIKSKVESPDGPMRNATVEALEIIARMPQDIQPDLARMFSVDYTPNANSLRRCAANRMRSLANAPFSVQACLKCTKRTGASPDLFDVVDGKLGECLDADCYNGKCMKAKVTLVDELRRERPGVVLFTSDYALSNETGVQNRWRFTECLESDERAVPAVHILENGEIKETFVVARPEQGSAEDDEPEDVPYRTLVESRVCEIVERMLNGTQENARNQFHKMLDAGQERQILRLIASFGYWDRTPSGEKTDGASAFAEASIDILACKLWKGFVAYVLQKSDDYKAMVLIARECGLATEQNLVDLAKKELGHEGVEDPDEDKAAPGGKQKKGKK